MMPPLSPSVLRICSVICKCSKSSCLDTQLSLSASISPNVSSIMSSSHSSSSNSYSSLHHTFMYAIASLLPSFPSLSKSHLSNHSLTQFQILVSASSLEASKIEDYFFGSFAGIDYPLISSVLSKFFRSFT